MALKSIAAGSRPKSPPKPYRAQQHKEPNHDDGPMNILCTSEARRKSSLIFLPAKLFSDLFAVFFSFFHFSLFHEPDFQNSGLISTLISPFASAN